METIVEWCNSLSRSYERACARSQEIGYEGAASSLGLPQ
jgi:hypothetical protein